MMGASRYLCGGRPYQVLLLYYTTAVLGSATLYRHIVCQAQIQAHPRSQIPQFAQIQAHARSQIPRIAHPDWTIHRDPHIHALMVEWSIVVFLRRTAEPQIRPMDTAAVGLFATKHFVFAYFNFSYFICSKYCTRITHTTMLYNHEALTS